MEKDEIIQILAESVRKFTSLKDFSSPNERSYNDHMEYRASLYRDMCEALRKYDESKKPPTA